jgi:OFA family oxalate/formate antiporter-like MFS transporter
LYIFFGVIVGVGNGFGYSTPTPVASKWFPDKRGLVVGLMVGGYGAGQAIFGTFANERLIPALGWRTTFQILSGIFLVMTMIGATLLKNPPAGYKPANWTPKAGAHATHADFTTGQMLSTPTFYLLWIAFAFGTTAGQMTISQLVPFARTAGLGATVATYSLIVTSLGNAGGRILSGWMSDTLGRLRTLQMMVFVSALAMPALFLLRSDVVPFFALIFLVYWCYGTQLSLFASTTADFYGTRNLGLNYGVLFTAWGAAGILGPGVAGRIFDRFGDYRYAFYSAAAFAVIAFVALLSAKPPSLQRAAGEVSLKNELIPAAPRA